MDVDRQTAFALGLRRPSASLLPPHTDVEHEPHPFVASLADTLHSLPGAPLAGDAIVLSAAEVLRLPEGAVGREEALQRTAMALARSRTAAALDLAHVCFALGALCLPADEIQKLLIADRIEEWWEGRACDGFVIGPTHQPGGFEDFVKYVIPELQKRGIYRKEYTGLTLRDHLGLQRPEIGAWRGKADAAE